MKCYRGGVAFLTRRPRKPSPTSQPHSTRDSEEPENPGKTPTSCNSTRTAFAFTSTDRHLCLCLHHPNLCLCLSRRHLCLCPSHPHLRLFEKWLAPAYRFLIPDTERRIQRERDDADAMTTMEKLIKIRGDVLFLTYRVQNHQYGGKPMVVKAAADDHYFVLAGIPNLFHSNASTDQSQRASLDSKFGPMLDELLPRTENGQVVKPPPGYYVVRPHKLSCSCPFVATQGSFRKVSSRRWWQK